MFLYFRFNRTFFCFWCYSPECRLTPERSKNLLAISANGRAPNCVQKMFWMCLNIFVLVAQLYLSHTSEKPKSQMLICSLSTTHDDFDLFVTFSLWNIDNTGVQRLSTEKDKLLLFINHCTSMKHLYWNVFLKKCRQITFLCIV